MRRFSDYLLTRMPLKDLLKEVSELFPTQAMNQLLRQEIDRLLSVARSQEAYDSLLRLRAIDATAYIDRVLRRAGFKTHDLDEMVQQIMVKLLMGSFFKAWKQESPIDARFKVAVTNAIRSLATKQQRSKKRSHELPADVAGQSSGSVAGGELLERFRDYVKKNLGDAALRLLDHRLEGGDTKELVGSLGLETSYRVKLTVGHIKKAARRFFAADPEMLSRIDRAFGQEAETMERRFGRRAAAKGSALVTPDLG